MIIPVVTKDIMYFSRLKSKINVNKYNLVQVKNRKEIENILSNENCSLLIVDFSDDLAKSIELKDLIKNKDIFSVGYYPHINENLKQNAIKFGTGKQVTRNQLFKNINDIVDELS